MKPHPSVSHRLWTRRGALGVGAASLLLSRGACAVDQAAALPITDILSSSDPPMVAAAFARAFARSRSVIIPAGFIIGGLDREIVVPSGGRLTIAGQIIGRTESASIVLPSSAEIVGAGGLLDNVGVVLQSGSPKVRGLRSTGHAQIAAVLLPGPGPYADVEITDFEFFDGNFGILRQGATSRLSGATIHRGKITAMWGDGIEWNVAPYDSGVSVDGIEIIGLADIDPRNRYDRRNWGIGVGFAGRTYVNGWPAGQAVRDFTIRNITGKHLRQLIHVENGTDFTIAGVQGHDIGDEAVAGDNIEAAHVICYGSSRFSISQVRGTGSAHGGGIKLRMGVRDRRYVSPCANFAIDDVALARGDLLLEMGNSDSFAKVHSVNLMDGMFEAVGACSTMRFDDVRVSRRRVLGPAIKVRVASGDGRGDLAARDARLEMSNLRAIDERGIASRSIETTGLTSYRVNP